jgi:hypothetical protein
MEPMVVEEFYGGPGPEDLANAAAAIAQALRQFAATEAQAASGLRACLPTPTEAGPISDVRRLRAVAAAAGEAAIRAALLLEAADIIAPGGVPADVGAALTAATKRVGLPPLVLVPLLRAAALSLPTDDASARIAATIRVEQLAAALAG